MRILTLEIQNFLPFGTCSLDFTKYKGVTLIEGRRSGSGAGSNGSGKTALFDSVSWLLFGKLIQRGSRSPSVKNRFLDGETVVSGMIEMPDKSTLRITRRRNKKGVTLDIGSENEMGTSMGVQEVLEKRLGFDHQLFTRAVMFSGKTSSFCAMTDAERKVLLEELLGLSYFAEASRIAADKAKAVEQTMLRAHSQILTLNETISTNNNMLGELESNAEQNRLNFLKSYNLKLEELHKVHDEADEEVDKCLSLQAKVEQAEKDYQAAVTEHSVKMETAQKLLREARTTARERRDERVRSESEYNRIAAELRDLKSGKHPEVCPTCRRAWPNDNKHADDLIAGKTRDLAKVEEKLSELRNKETRSEEKMEEAEQEVEALTETSPQRSEIVEDWQTAKDNVQEMDRRIASIIRDIVAQRRAYKSVAGSEMIGSIRTRIEEAQDSLQQAEGLEDQSKVEFDIFTFWKNAFSKHGIPHTLLESSMPILNREANKYLSLLTDGQGHVEFSADEGSLKTVASFEDGADCYDMTSAGERMRIDLSTLFAIRELMAGRMGAAFSQIFLDETADGLDENGVEGMVNMLRKGLVSKGNQVFIISHNSDLKGLCDSSIIVNKAGNVSAIKG